MSQKWEEKMLSPQHQSHQAEQGKRLVEKREAPIRVMRDELSVILHTISLLYILKRNLEVPSQCKEICCVCHLTPEGFFLLLLIEEKIPLASDGEEAMVRYTMVEMRTQEKRRLI